MIDLTESEATEIDDFVTSHAMVSPVITAQNLCSINSCPDQQMYRARIQFLFQLDSYVQNEQGEVDEVAREVLIDLVHDAILFASDTQITYSKSIVFLTLYIAMLQQVIFQPYYQPEKLLKKFEHALLIHSVERPPSSSGIFDISDIKILQEFFITKFFRNAKMIQYCFTKRPILSFRTLSPTMIELPPMPALSEMEMDQSTLSSSAPESAKETASDEQKQPTSQRDSGRSSKSRDRSTTSPRGQESQEQQQQKPPEQQISQIEQEEVKDRGPQVPTDILKETLSKMHEKFVAEFDEKERVLIGKIKEIEIHMGERQNAPAKKTTRKK